MGLNDIGESTENTETPKWILIAIETDKFDTPKGSLEEISNIIDYIREQYKLQKTHLLIFRVNNTNIGIGSWCQHGFIKDEYNIPRLCMCIYDKLNPEQQQNFQKAFANISMRGIGIEPDESLEEILRGVAYYLNQKIGKPLQ